MGRLDFKKRAFHFFYRLKSYQHSKPQIINIFLSFQHLSTLIHKKKKQKKIYIIIIISYL